MKKTFAVSVMGVLITFSLLVATTPKELLQLAKDFGLEAMPSGKELRKIQLEKIKELGIKTKKLFTTDQIELGKMLYFDPRLSASNLISCNTCHNLGLGGVDIIPAAIGHKWQANPKALNSPTVYNSLFNTVQFWDGRSHDLGDQAQGPIQNPVEMSSSPDLAVARIKAIPEYAKIFQKAYGEDTQIDLKLIADSIAIFEATLVTPSRYDEFMSGNFKALSKEEQEGFQIFLDKGCANCHNGINLGGKMHSFAVIKPYRFANIGGFQGDKDGNVKVPTLRNVVESMPYFHNGAFWNLNDAIKEMGSIQLGLDITDEEAEKIKIFLRSLTGKKPKIVYPILPANGEDMPKPVF